jgi:hypothetical protein
MSSKHLLTISKNYWGANTSERCATTFSTKFSTLLSIPSNQITTLIGNDVTLATVKTTISQFVYDALLNNHYQPILYIYINGHGNQIVDANGDEIQQDINIEETPVDAQDELYQLPDGNLVDDELTNIINNAVYCAQALDRPLVVLISDHCSSGSMLDKIHISWFDWISFGSSTDTEDSYITGDGNVMTMNLLNVMENNKDKLHDLTAIEFYQLLDKEMKNSFIGELQHATIHVSNRILMDIKPF